MKTCTIISLIFSFFLFGTNGLSAQDKDSVTVYLFMAEDCKICQYYTPLLNELYGQIENENIGFLGIFPNRYSTESGIDGFSTKYDIKFPLKKEYYQTLTKKFEATITPEVVVYNEDKQKIIYKGRIDDSYVKIGKRQRVIKNHELRDVLSAINSFNDVVIQNQPAIGCFIMTK